mgnify:CR=1 FL=1
MGAVMNTEFENRFLSARRAVIASRFSSLNDMQLQAALTTEGPLLLLAGAGSGKTTVLIQRIANLISYGCASDSAEIPDYICEEDVTFLEQYLAAPEPSQKARADALCALRPVAPWSIIAITFTNKAANELKERLTRMLGTEALDVWAMTFHSACCRILRRDIEKLGFDRSFTIYDTSDSERVVKDILRDMSLDEKVFAPRLVLSIVSKAKDKRQEPAEFERTAAFSGDYRMEKIALIYAEYQKRLKEANALDFDDIILKTVELLERFEDVRTYYQKKFRYVLIDEYQDTNLLQYQLSSLLAGGYENICVVGDDDQSIYKFRGATIENILSFEKQYRGAKVIRLEQNYRSTEIILQAANAVISHNKGRKGKTLWTKNGGGEKITVYEANDGVDEANYVANRIITRSHGRGFKDYAVLYRTNAQSNAMEYAFKRSGVPYRIIGGTRFFDRAEVKDMLAYLCVINNRADDLRLRRILNNPPRGIGNTTIERVQDLASEQGVPMMAVLQHAGEYAVLKSAAGKLERFAQLIAALREMADTMELAEFYDAVCEQTSYVRTLQEKGDVESRGRLENVQELKSNIVSFLENDPEDATLSGFLNEIALYTDLDSATSDNCVTMMTMHSAKGLEFPCVYVVGVEEGIFPGERVRYNDEEVEEERRLCYVAMTRAKERLTMTCTRQRMLFGRTSVSEPSRFLEEVPSENADWVGRQAQGASGFGDTSFDEGSSYSTRGYGSYGQGAARYDSVMQRRPKSQASQKLAAQKPAASAPLLQLSSGDQIHHKTFGDGLVISVTPMGGDALLEVAFDTVGTKKLMLKTAGVHITKL